MHFLIIKARAVNSVVCPPILSKFECIQDIIHILLICNFKKGQINSNREKVKTLISIHSRAANSVVSCLIWQKSKDIQPFMIVLITDKTEEDSFRNEGNRVVKHFPHCKSIGNFPAAQGQLKLHCQKSDLVKI